MTGPTERQAAVLEFIRERIAANGYPPTIREVMARFGFRGPNGVLGHLKALERKGFIVRDSGHARGIRVVGAEPRANSATPARLSYLTPVQLRVYRMLVESPVPPTIRDISARMGWSSPNATIGHLKALEREGLIRRTVGHARAITVV